MGTVYSLSRNEYTNTSPSGPRGEEDLDWTKRSEQGTAGASGGEPWEGLDKAARRAGHGRTGRQMEKISK